MMSTRSGYVRMFTALVFAILILVCLLSVLYPQELLTYSASFSRHKNKLDDNSKSTENHITKPSSPTRSVTPGLIYSKTETPKMKITTLETFSKPNIANISSQPNSSITSKTTTNKNTNPPKSQNTTVVQSTEHDAADNRGSTNFTTPTITTNSRTNSSFTARAISEPYKESIDSSEIDCKNQTSQVENTLKASVKEQFIMFKDAMSAVQRERQAILDRVCHGTPGVNRSRLHPDYGAFESGSKTHHPTIYYTEKYRVMFCEVAKAGCTQLKLAFLEMENIVSDPYKLEHESIHAHAYGARTMLEHVNNKTKIRDVLDNYLKIITVRNPFERILSAYFDKLAPRANFTHPKYTPISERIRKKYHKNDTQQKRASFENFIDFLLAENVKGSHLDLHWDLFTRACDPCSYHYNYIARLETIEKDARYLEDILGLNNDTRRRTPITLFHGAKDNKTKAKTSMQKMRTNFLKVPKHKRLKLYEMYKPDFEAFGYPYPEELLE